MESLTGRLFVPERPTLRPGMLLGGRRTAPFPPFDRRSAVWFYLARNAVWRAARLLGLDGAEVLVPAYHHGVEVEALAAAGAVPVFYPVSARCEVDPDDLRKRLTPRTRALYLIHYLGIPGPALELRKLADERGVALLEDCALALLSSDGERALGTLGDASVFCLYKSLPTPDGGALVAGPGRPAPAVTSPPGAASTASHALNSLLENLELRGGTCGRWTRAGVRTAGRAVARACRLERVPTGTMHFDAGRAALGISPLSLRIARSLDLPAIVDARRRNYAALLDRLREASPPLFGELAPGVCPLFYPLTTDDKPEVLRRLRAAGVEAGDFWSLRHPACGDDAFPDAAALRRTIVELPCHQDLDPPTVERVADAARAALPRPARPRSVPEEPLALEVVREPAAFAALRQDWAGLMERADGGVFNAWDWLYPWHRRLAPDLAPFVLTARDRDGRLVGVLPLALERRRLATHPFRRLGFLGGREVGSDYLDAVAARGREEQVVRAFARLLLELRAEWDILDLVDIDEDSPTPRLLREAAEREGFICRESQRFVCPHERLRPGEPFDDYLARTRRRDNYLRRRRWLESQPGFRVETASAPEDLPRSLSAFFALHASRWGDAGNADGAMTRRVELFHRDSTRLLAADGKLRLYTLRLGERALAAVYAIVHGGRFYYYQSAYDPAWRDRSVGLVLLGATFEDALRLGVREYDFLRGDEAYKSDWAALRRRTVRLRIFPPGGVGAWRARLEDASRGTLSRLKSVLPARAVEAMRRFRAPVGAVRPSPRSSTPCGSGPTPPRPG